MDNKTSRKLQQILQKVNAGHLQAAIQECRLYIEQDPNNGALNNVLGALLGMSGLHKEAESFLKKAAQIDPKNPAFIFNLGKCKEDQGKVIDALADYQRVIGISPDYTQAWIGIARINAEENNETLHRDLVSRAPIKVKNIPEFISLEALFLENTGKMTEALEKYEIALKADSSLFATWSNLGSALRSIRRFKESASCFERSLSLKPDFSEAWHNYANLLVDCDNLEAAVLCYQKASEFNPGDVSIRVTLGETLSELKRDEDCIKVLSACLDSDPKINFARAALIYNKLRSHDWQGIEDHAVALKEQIQKNEVLSNPWHILSAIDDPQIQHQAAQNFVKKRVKIYDSVDRNSPTTQTDRKIRIAYFSTDFKEHPVAYALANIIKAHDRNQFEVIGVDFNCGEIYSATDMFASLFDKFVRAGNLSDAQVIELSRDLRVDIAVDLVGHTKGSRLGVFAGRCAPLQVSYLGYAGTTGASFLDYIIATKDLIAEVDRPYFSEKVCTIPGAYMTYELPECGAALPSRREDVGLPAEGVVFCCFHSPYKLSEIVFNCWLSILRDVENSVLWFSSQPEKSQNILKTYAESKGISSNRILFAAKLKNRSDHISRIRLADIALDTFPYNGHTSTLENLAASVPVITIRGNTFASRVASNILSSFKLDELIADSLPCYQEITTELAKDPDRLQQLKKSISNEQLRSMIFSGKELTQKLEMGYKKIWDRYESGLSPDHINC